MIGGINRRAAIALTAGAMIETVLPIGSALTELDHLASSRSECGRVWCMLVRGTLSRAERQALTAAAERRNRLLDAAEARMRRQ